MQVKKVASNVGTLEDLVEAGRSRVLDAPEVSNLAHLALRNRQDDHVVLDFLRAGTAASRTNVLSFRAAIGKRPYAPSERKPLAKTAYPVSPVTQLQERLAQSGPLALTHHALTRFIERHAADVPIGDALAALEAEIRGAQPIKEKSAKGDRLWIGPAGTLLVVKPTETTSHGWGPSDVVVTILPRGSREDAHIRQDTAA
jgi:hypothetical protein